MQGAGFEVFGISPESPYASSGCELSGAKSCILRQGAILIAFGCRRKGNTGITRRSGASVQDRCRIQAVV
jgi:hypothetical protein